MLNYTTIFFNKHQFFQRSRSLETVYFLDEFDTFASNRLFSKTTSDREYSEIANVLPKEMDHINSY